VFFEKNNDIYKWSNNLKCFGKLVFFFFFNEMDIIKRLKGCNVSLGGEREGEIFKFQIWSGPWREHDRVT
jgi:hypothetical protein